MTKPVAIPEDELARIREFCADRSPAHLHDQVRVDMTRRGRTVTIIEQSRFASDWIDLSVARMTFDPDAGHWTLYWPDSDSRFHRYEHLPPGPLAAVLHEIDLDPHCIFWG